jgi:protein-tyrosine phosphatase
VVDIHSHVIWGLDDGARDLAESLAMLQVAAASGTTDIVATPHANIEYEFDFAKVQARLDELQRAAPAVPRLHRGCDLHFYARNIEAVLLAPNAYCINGGPWLLIEFSDFLILPETSDWLSQLRAAGLRPILTHPERNMLLASRMAQLLDWRVEGLTCQVTAQSLTGRFGIEAKRFAEDLIARGMVDFIASDAHDTEDRPPRLDAAFSYVAKKFGAEYAEAVFVANPFAVTAGKPLPHTPAPRRRRWFHFLK